MTISVIGQVFVLISFRPNFATFSISGGFSVIDEKKVQNVGFVLKLSFSVNFTKAVQLFIIVKGFTVP